MTYQNWNNLLFRFFFNEDNAGKPVTFYIDRHLLDDIGKKYGGTQGFLNSIAIKTGQKIHFVNLLRLLLEKDRFHAEEENYIPLYFNALCLTILAWTVEENLNAANYYDRLNKLLIEGYNSVVPKENNYRFLVGSRVNQGKDNLFRQLIMTAFKRLSEFTKEAKDCELGFYEFRQAGTRYVDIPKAQALINAKDRKGLEEFFFERGVEPGSTVTLEEAKFLFQSGGIYHVTNATKIRWRKDSHNKTIIQDIICSLVKHWDGTYEESNFPLDEDNKIANKLHGVYIWPTLQSSIFGDSFILKARLELLNGDFPVDKAITITINGNQIPAFRQFDGWSHQVDLNEKFWNYLFKGNNTKTIKAENPYKILFFNRPVTIFEESYELGGFIPAREIEPDRNYFILVNNKSASKFLLQNIDSLKPCELKPKLKSHSLFRSLNSIEGLEKIAGIRKRSENKILELYGGAKIGHGSRRTYSHLAPPKIHTFKKLPENYSIVCKYGMNKTINMEMDQNNPDVYHLPKSIDTLSKYDVAVLDEESNISSQFEPISFILFPCIMPQNEIFSSQETGFHIASQIEKPQYHYLYDLNDFKLEILSPSRLTTSELSFVHSEDFDYPQLINSHDLLDMKIFCNSEKLFKKNKEQNTFELPKLKSGQHQIHAEWHGLKIFQSFFNFITPPIIQFKLTGAKKALKGNEDICFIDDKDASLSVEIIVEQLEGPQLNVFLNRSKIFSMKSGKKTIRLQKKICSNFLIRWGGIDIIEKNYTFHSLPKLIAEVTANSGTKWQGSNVYGSTSPPTFDVYLERLYGFSDDYFECFINEIRLSLEKIKNGISTYKIPIRKVLAGTNLSIRFCYCGIDIPVQNSPKISLCSKPKLNINLIGKEIEKNTYLSNYLPLRLLQNHSFCKELYNKLYKHNF